MEIFIFTITLIMVMIVIATIDIICHKPNHDDEYYDIYIEEIAPSQNSQARQKVLERLINDQNTIKSLTILNTILILALIIIVIVERIFT